MSAEDNDKGSGKATFRAGIIKGGGGGYNKFKKKQSNTGKPKSTAPATATANTKKASFKGDTEDIKSFLSLSREHSTTGHEGFTHFQNQLEAYVLREYDNPEHLMPLILNLIDPVPAYKATRPTTTLTLEELKADPVEQLLLDGEVKAYSTGLVKLKANMVTLWGHIWGQCTPSLRAELEADDDFRTQRATYDSLWLLRACKKIIASINKRGNKHYNAYQVLCTFNSLRQFPDESPQEWLHRFQSSVETVYLAKCDHIFYSKEISNLTNESDDNITLEKRKMEAMYFLLHSDSTRFGSMQDDLYKDMIKGDDMNYPLTPNAVYDMMIQWMEQPVEQTHFTDTEPTTRVSYTMVRLTSGKEVEVNQNETHPGVSGKVVDRPCFNCGKWGHLMSDCPSLTEANRTAIKDKAAAKKSTSLLHVRFCGVHHKDLILPHYIMLDSCSESSIVMNTTLVHGIKHCSKNETLLLVTNGGSMRFDQMGTLNLFPMKVHVNSASMANILSLKEVGDIHGVRVTMDTSQERAIHVHVEESGLTYMFLEGPNGLYFFDTTNPDKHIKPTISAYSFLSTVSAQKSNFTSDQIKGAEIARQLQEKIGWPSTKDLKRYINTNSIINCPITADDVIRADYIYGPALPLLQGKTTAKSTRFHSPPAVLPSPILNFHQNIELFIDFLYVNKIPFLHTKSKNINFLTIQHHGSRKIKGVTTGLTETLQIYRKRGFNITTIHADNEFNKHAIIEAVRPTTMQIYARNEHVGVAERSIRTLKERCRCICHSLPYKRFTKLMTTALLEHVVSWLNDFPSNDGISDTLSPSAIVVGRPNLNMNQPLIEFGAYAAVHNGTTNTMKGRVTPAIALNRSNDKGGCYFMSLETGKRIHGFIWTTKPINPQVIDQVHQMARRENQPRFVNDCPIFEWSPGNAINDETYEEDENDDDEDSDYVQESESDDELETDDDNSSLEIEEEDEQQLPPIHEVSGEDEFVEDEEENNIEIEDVLEGDEDEGIEVNEANTNNDAEPINNEAEAPPDNLRRSKRENAGKGVDRLQMDFKGKKYWSFMMKRALIRNGMKGVKLRSAQARSYLMAKTIQNNREDDYMQIVTRVLFMQQMSAKKGIDEFGKRAIAALFKEFKQLNDGPMPGKPVIEPINYDKLTKDMKEQAMNAINLIGQKDCGKIKGRSCADGRKQKRYLKEDENVSSPTASLEAINTTWVIDAYEGRDVVTSDVPGAYLHANMPEDKVVTMKFRGKQVIDILCEVNPEFKNYISMEKGQQVLYVRVLRAIYGSIYSGLLWYDLFTNTLKDMGFELNPYDKCVANKTVNGKQCTIVWYVDDLKISHMEHAVNMEIIDKLREHFGDLKATTGDSHTYLGVNYTIDRKKKCVHMEAKKQVQEATNKFPDHDLREVKSPSGQGLFSVDEELKLLAEDKAEIFHSVVAKLLWLEKRVRPDIEPTIAFLSTRVSAPNTSDWEKLARLVDYLNTTIEDDRIMGADSLSTLYTWIDAAYAVHPNMRSHTGGCMSMGTGTLHARSSKQKLNTKSSTEAEVVGLSEYIPYNIWLIHFLEAQGYHLTTNHVHQENQSAIKMEKNGRHSCTGNSRHINIRYFFVKDRVDKGEMRVKTSLC